MGEQVISKHQKRSGIARLAGTTVTQRVRRTGAIVFGFFALAGLALVALFAQGGYPLQSFGPLPLPPSDESALGGALGLDAGYGAGGSGDGPLALVDDGRFAADGSALATAEGSPLPVAFEPESLPGVDGGGDSPTGLGNNPGLGAGDAAITPAQEPTDPPETVPAAEPVSGSSSSAGLFVRASVDNGKGEDGGAAPTEPETEPEVPVEPELPIEPEPPVEPEPPAEPQPSEPESGPAIGPNEPAAEPEVAPEAEPVAEPEAPAEAAPEAAGEGS